MVGAFENETPDPIPDDFPLGGCGTPRWIMRSTHNFPVTGAHSFTSKRWGTIPMLLTVAWVLLQKGCVLSPDIAPAQTMADARSRVIVSASAMAGERHIPEFRTFVMFQSGNGTCRPERYE